MWEGSSIASIASLVIQMGVDSTRVASGFRNVERRATDFRQRISQQYNQLSRSIIAAGTAFAASFAIRGTFAALDTVTNINNQLISAGVSADNVGDAFQRIRDLANDSRASLASTATLFSQILIATRRFGSDAAQAAIATRAIQQSFQIAGTSAASAAGATTQLLQALQSGVLRGEEFNSVNENSNILIRQIAASIGVSVDNMRALAAEGALTADVVFAALLDSADDIQRQFDNTTVTFEQIGTLIRNNILPAFAGVASLIQPVVQGFADWVGEVDNVNRLIAGIAGAFAAITALTVINGIIRIVSLFRTLVTVLRSVSFFSALSSAGIATATGAAAFTAAVLAYNSLTGAAEDASDAIMTVADNNEIVGQSFDEALESVNRFRMGLMGANNETNTEAMALNDSVLNSFQQFRNNAMNEFELFSSLAQQTFTQATDSILDFFETGRLNLRDFVADFLRGFARIRIQQALLGAFGGPTSSFLSGLPGRQFGGSVTGGRPYIVGEAGPELFVPRRLRLRGSKWTV